MQSAPPENSGLPDLPLDVITANVALDVESVRRLNLVCRHFSFFNVGTPLRTAYQLLNCIDRADWAGATQIAQQVPEAMFLEVYFKGINGQRARTSAVMWSFKLVDTGMSRLLWQVAQVNPLYIARFLTQARAQQAVLSMDFLNNAYHEYEMSHRLCMRDLALESTKLTAWKQLSQAQMLCVPVHMLKIWCAASSMQMAFDWGNPDSLKVTQPEIGLFYLYDRTRVDVETYFNLAASGDYVLMRGRNNAALDLLVYQQSGARGGHHVLRYDHKGLLTLYDLKLKEQAAFREELELSLRLTR